LKTQDDENKEVSMTSDVFTLLAKYNRGVNEKMNGYIQGLSDGEWKREFQGYFSSVRSLCSHLYISDFNWLKRFGGVKTFSALKDPLFEKTFMFTDSLFSNKEEYLSKRPELDGKLTALAGEITDGDLSKTVKYSNYRGEVIEKEFEILLMQMFNHETHHRGMISLYLEFLGRENDFSAVMPIVCD
jgi:uncharacterized damage-inducible protein DinB